MKYSKVFIDILDYMPDKYIGYGNPNAKILFIGQEPAIDRISDVGQYEREIVRNWEQWHTIVSNNRGYESVANSDYSPMHPYANQKYQVRSKKQNGSFKGREGTSTTWYNYQKLINKIFEAYSIGRKPMTKDDHLDFHRLSFHTDMSAAAFKYHSKTHEGKNSVKERVPLFCSGFFYNFPIVIAAVGHFPHDTYGDSYFGDIFRVSFIGNEGIDQSEWMNISIRDNETNPMLLIHTPQFSGALSDRYIDHMARRVVDFASEHGINLLPKE